MIGRLRGILLEKRPPFLLVDVQGVGYEVEAPMSTFYELPALGEGVMLHTHLAIKDDAHSLYGFASERERALFRSLIKVTGIGPKLGLTLLSGIRAEDFVRCIEHEDIATLTRLPGVGKKTAERLIIEMRDRVKDIFPSAAATDLSAPIAVGDDASADAVSALVALGYKPAEAARLVREVGGEYDAPEAIIRLALQRAVRQP